MADDDLGSEVESANVESDDDFSMSSEDDSHSDSLDLGFKYLRRSKDPAVVVQALKDLRGVISGVETWLHICLICANNLGKDMAAHSRVQYSHLLKVLVMKAIEVLLLLDIERDFGSDLCATKLAK